jgi:phage-related protein
MANEIPIDLVMRVNDQMSTVLDSVAAAADETSRSFDKMTDEGTQISNNLTRQIPLLERISTRFLGVSDSAKKATGIKWDESTNRWRDASNKFISSQEAMQKGFSAADKALYQYKKEAGDAEDATSKLAKSMQNGTQQTGGFSVKLAALGNIAGDLAMKALSAVGAAVGDVVGEMISGNAEMQRYETQFGVLLGSTDKAKDRLKELAEFGASTPFELPEVVRADKILQGFGLHSEESAKKFGMSGTQIRTLAGDMAAGTGQSFEDMAGYLGKFASGSTGEAISRFQELGITTREELAKMGLEFSKSGELTTPTAEAFTVLAKVAQEKFGGMMEAQSATFEGMVSNLEDWKSQTIRTIGEPIFEIVSDKLGVLLKYLSSSEVKSAIDSFAKGMADTLRTVVDWVDRNWPTIQAVITTVFTAIDFAVNNVLRPIINFIVEMFEVLAGRTEQNFNEINTTIDRVMEDIGNIIDTVLFTVAQLWEDYGEDIMNFVRETWQAISDIVSGVVGIIVRLIEVAMPSIEKTVDDAMDTLRIAFALAWAAIEIVVGTSLDLISGVVNAVLQLLNGDTEGALDTLRAMFMKIWTRIYETVEGAISDIKAVIDDRLSATGTSVDEYMTGIWNTISNAWTSAYNTVDYWVGTIRNLTSAAFQEMRDDVTLSFNTMKDNIINALRTALNFYNSIAPFLGYPVIPTNGIFGQRSGASSTTGAPASRATTFNLTANYGNQDERSLRDDVQMLQMLYGGV